jgi:hypothetical protein
LASRAGNKVVTSEKRLVLNKENKDQWSD